MHDDKKICKKKIRKNRRRGNKNRTISIGIMGGLISIKKGMGTIRTKLTK